jgi:hypothetical protein
MALVMVKLSLKRNLSKGFVYINRYGVQQKQMIFVLWSGAQVDQPPLLTRYTIRTSTFLGRKHWEIGDQFKFGTMKEIKTLVYFDLEATGLKSSGNPRITEISLLAVNIQDILDLHERIKA